MGIELPPANLFGQRRTTAEQESLDAKRDYNIKLREERYARKQKEHTENRKAKKAAQEARKIQLKQIEAQKRQTELRAGLKRKENSIGVVETG